VKASARRCWPNNWNWRLFLFGSIRQLARCVGAMELFFRCFGFSFF
jgi:hypothetical protein